MLRSLGQLVRRTHTPCMTALRSFAEGSATVQSATTKAPSVPTHGTYGRYALALYMAGQKAGKLDVLDKDLTTVWKLASESDEFAQFLRDPSVPKSQKAAVLQEVLSTAKVSELTKNFFMVLAENNRLSMFDKIVVTFGELMAAARGQVTCTITSAEPLGKKDLEDVKTGLKSMLKKGESLLIRQKVEPEIIGGIVVQIADKYIDLSIRTRVKKIQQLILETV